VAAPSENCTSTRAGAASVSGSERPSTSVHGVDGKGDCGASSVAAPAGAADHCCGGDGGGGGDAEGDVRGSAAARSDSSSRRRLGAAIVAGESTTTLRRKRFGLRRHLNGSAEEPSSLAAISRSREG
jgi:hypothetical protein